MCISWLFWSLVTSDRSVLMFTSNTNMQFYYWMAVIFFNQQKAHSHFEHVHRWSTFLQFELWIWLLLYELLWDCFNIALAFYILLLKMYFDWDCAADHIFCIVPPSAASYFCFLVKVEVHKVTQPFLQNCPSCFYEFTKLTGGSMVMYSVTSDYEHRRSVLLESI